MLHISASFSGIIDLTKRNFAALLPFTQELFHLFCILFCQSKPYAPLGITKTDYDYILYCIFLLILACFSFFPLLTEGKTFAVQHPFQHNTIQTRTGVPY